MAYLVDKNNFALVAPSNEEIVVTEDYTLRPFLGDTVKVIQLPLQFFQLNTIIIPPIDMSTWATYDVYANGELINPNGDGYITFHCDSSLSEDLKCSVMQTPLIRLGAFIGTGNTVTGYVGSGGEVEMPRGIVAIGSSAFEGRTAITRVELSETLQAIGTNAFKGCTGLTSIEFKTSLEILENMFSGCTAVTSIELGVGVQVWYDNADFSFTNMLTAESLSAIIAKLRDYSSGSTHTLTIGLVNKSRLTTAQIAEAEAKNWTVI